MDEARELPQNTEELVALLKETKQDIRRIESQTKSRILLLHKKAAKISGVLRDQCEHEWRRDPHPYADLYCKKCSIWK